MVLRKRTVNKKIVQPAVVSKMVYFVTIIKTGNVSTVQDSRVPKARQANELLIIKRPYVQILMSQAAKCSRPDVVMTF